MRQLAALLPCALLTCCGSAPQEPVVGYRTPEVPSECRQAVYQDPTVRHLLAAGAAVPIYAAEKQNELAFAEAEAERKCMRDKGLMQGGVEPVKHVWYPFPF